MEDVQFFSAPLVAAFTVHQDERGVPKSVVPIYKQQEEQKKIASNVNVSNTLQSAAVEDYNKQRILLQEQQRALEMQILELQRQQQRYQDYLLQQRPIFQPINPSPPTLVSLQPSLAHHFANPVSRQPSFTLQPTPLPLFTSTPHTVSSFTRRPLPVFQSPSVSLQPSLSLTSTVFPRSVQQLPNKNPVDFNKNSHPLRVFRHETQTGNFLNAPFPDRAFQRNFGVNRHLNDLIYRSGVSVGKQQEDLSIISKVLSLNHLRRDGLEGLQRRVGGFNYVL